MRPSLMIPDVFIQLAGSSWLHGLVGEDVRGLLVTLWISLCIGCAAWSVRGLFGETRLQLCFTRLLVCGHCLLDSYFFVGLWTRVMWGTVRLLR